MLKYNDNGLHEIIPGRYEIVNCYKKFVHIGVIVLDKEHIQFVDICGVEGNDDLRELEKLGKMPVRYNSYGDVVVDSVLNGYLVFKRDFIWVYPTDGKWKIIGYYREFG